MKAKRAKQYRKLMQQYGLAFGLREPYQVLIDAGMLQDADRFKMDLVRGLERTLCGKVKPMITQCSIRHLYDAIPKNESLISLAKTFERRRCNHPIDSPALSTLNCLSEVVDPKSQGINKFHYVVASQDDGVRAKLREIPGVPLIYIKRSIMILEPMAGASLAKRSKEERGKFKEGVARLSGRGGGVLGKRTREDGDGEGSAGAGGGATVNGAAAQEPERKRKKKGPKGPNPLSVKKPKAREPQEPRETSPQPAKESDPVPRTNETLAEGTKKKRKRKHKDKSGAGADGVSIAAAGDMSDG